MAKTTKKEKFDADYFLDQIVKINDNNQELPLDVYQNPGALNYYLNCVNIPGGVDCIEANINNIVSHSLSTVTIASLAGSNISQYISVRFALYINRAVTIPGQGTSTCHDLFGSESAPRISNSVNLEHDVGSDGLIILDFGLPELDLFSRVDEWGEMPLTQFTEFDAVYQIKLYIHDYVIYEIAGYDSDILADNVYADDINTPFEQEVIIHHQPYTDCAYAQGDVTGNGVNCDDFYHAVDLVNGDLCGGSDPYPECCALWNLAPPFGTADTGDFIVLLNLLINAGHECQ